MKISPFHQYPLYSNVKEGFINLHLLYCRGMQVSRALLYTTVEEGSGRILHPTVKGRVGCKQVRFVNAPSTVL